MNIKKLLLVILIPLFCVALFYLFIYFSGVYTFLTNGLKASHTTSPLGDYVSINKIRKGFAEIDKVQYKVEKDGETVLDQTFVNNNLDRLEIQIVSFEESGKYKSEITAETKWAEVFCKGYLLYSSECEVEAGKDYQSGGCTFEIY
ncbi:hypothetical protein JW766_01355 [Candidatus Dojkabacteria bacterium]|nr:hypothetical protein [Candidatus Dojkabacteria bacterium]